MGTRQNKTRLGEWEYSIQKPMANNVTIRNGLFVALVDGYIVPADGTTEIEGCAINDRFSGENNEHRYCIYQPRRDWETFTMEVDNGEIKQEDVGKTFRITSGLQHINYSTKAEVGGQFRLEEVLSPTLGTFTYNKATQFAPQGPQGNDGQTPNLQIGTVAKLQPDANPTAQLVQDPDDPTMYTLNLGIPAGATGPRGIQGETGANGTNGRDGQDGQDGQNGSEGEPGEPGASPKWKGDRTGGTTYYYLNMVRYPDSNNVYWTWIRDYLNPTTGVEVPGTDPNWKKMNRDGEPGPQGDAGGTIVVPVEGKPGKDGIGVDGRDGTDGKSPTDRGERDVDTNYDPLDMVRAFTGEYDQYGYEIRGYYITENGAYQDDPKDGDPRQLMCRDGQANKGNPYSIMVGLNTGVMVTAQFDEHLNLPAKDVTFDSYTGNKAMLFDNLGRIKILKTGHYRVFGHLIVNCNSTGGNQFINIGRFSVVLTTQRTGTPQGIFLSTSKSGGPSSTGANEGPWLDLYVDTQLDLYEGDLLFATLRLQSDDANAYDTGTQTGERSSYKIIGADDTSGVVEGGMALGGLFATYMGVEYLSAHTRQENAQDMIISAI